MIQTATFDEVRDGLGGYSAIVIDVRTVEEREKPGRIPGSTNVPCKMSKKRYYELIQKVIVLDHGFGTGRIGTTMQICT